MRDRLTALIEKADETVCGFSIDGDIGILADFILADGWIRPPCEVGQTVFFITFCCVGNGKPLYYITEGKITSFSFDKSGLWFYTVHGDGLRYWHKNDSIGINVFFTREDAEKALAERSRE